MGSTVYTKRPTDVKWGEIWILLGLSFWIPFTTWQRQFIIYLIMEFLLKRWTEICWHLTKCIAGGVSHTWMLKIEAHMERRLFYHAYLTVTRCTQVFSFKQMDASMHCFSLYFTWSCKNGKTAPTTSFNISSICLWQPSPQAEIAIRAACLYLQSAEEQKISLAYCLWAQDKFDNVYVSCS